MIHELEKLLLVGSPFVDEASKAEQNQDDHLLGRIS